jgi:serine protease inhibitor
MQCLNKNYFLILISFSLIVCNKEHSTELLSKPCVIPNTEKILVENSNNLGFDCFKEFAVKYENNENILISPIGLSQSINYLIKASDKNSRDQLKRSINLADIGDSIIEEGFNHLNHLYSEIDYISKISNISQIALSENIVIDKNFSNFDINRNYAEIITDETAGFIEDNDINNKDIHDNRFQLINTINISLKCKYQNKIEESPFYNSPNDSRFVEMIVSKAKFNYYVDQTIKAVDLPMGRGNFNLLVLLPQNSETIGDLCRKLDKRLIKRIKAKLKASDIELRMPVIEIKGIKTLKDFLKHKNLNNLFNEKNPDFTKISSQTNLYISDFEQIVDLSILSHEFDKPAFSSNSIENENKESILIDHPFVFIIYEKYSEGILLIGKIVSL